MDKNSTVPLTQTVSEISGLVNNLLLLLSDKEKDVIKKRFSLDDVRKYTLDEIGKEFSVTRERVRQIEKNALIKMRRNVFNTSLKHLHEFTLSVVKKSGGLMKEDLLLSELATVLPAGLNFDKSCVHLSLVLHDNLECIGNTINFYPYVREKSLAEYSLKYAANQLVNQLYKYESVKPLEKLFDDLKSVFIELGFDISRVKSLIKIDKRMLLLEDNNVGLVEWRNINPRTLRDKILYILRQEKKPLHFVDIADKISKSSFDCRPVNLQAVHNELIRHDQFILIGRGIYALREWGYERGTVAMLIEDLLKKEKEMAEDEIIESILKQRQVKKITIVLALKNGKKFERIGRKRYKLAA